jgi:hypothetical protein
VFVVALRVVNMLLLLLPLLLQVARDIARAFKLPESKVVQVKVRVVEGSRQRVKVAHGLVTAGGLHAQQPPLLQTAACISAQVVV